MALMTLDEESSNGVVMNAKTATQVIWNPTSTTLRSLNTFDTGTHWAKSEFKLLPNGTYEYRLSTDYDASTWFQEGTWRDVNQTELAATYEVNVQTFVGSFDTAYQLGGYSPLIELSGGDMIWAIQNNTSQTQRTTGFQMTIREVGQVLNVDSITITLGADIGSQFI